MNKALEMNHLINFYDKLFLYYYNLKKNSDDTPEYFPIIILSTAQAVNLFFIIILIFYLLKIDFSPLPEFFLVLDVGMIVFNFYWYQIKERKEIVLKKDLRLSLGFKIGSYLYVLVSIAAPLLLIYFLNEFLT